MLNFIVNRPNTNEKFMIVRRLCKKCIKTKNSAADCFLQRCIFRLYAHDAAGLSLCRIRKISFAVSENAVPNSDVVIGNAPLLL